MLGFTSGGNMRGLNEFISDIRACKDKESQEKRVDLQLANIRKKFTTDKGLSAYHRKKYTWKLLYIHILGYQVDFGFQQAAGLINSSKYDQKYTGYVAASILFSQKNVQIWKQITNAIQSDLRSRNQPAQSLAFSMIATIVPDALVLSVAQSIIDVAVTGRVSLNVRRKAILCLARIIRKYPTKYDSRKFVSPICDMLDNKSAPLSFLSSAASLLLTCQQVFNPEHFRDAQPKVARLLHKLAINKQCSTQYLYFTVANPWLQMKLYKILQLWSPPQQKGVYSVIQQILTKVLKRTDASKSINKNNVQYGLLFQAINVIIHYDKRIGQKVLQDLSKILTVFISSSQANIRYLGLQSMCRLALKNDLSKHQSKILANLEDADVSIRRRALDLLYLICNPNNSSAIVGQLLGYLQTRNDPLIKDDLVLKIAILAQKFAQNLRWYVDVVVNLIKNAEVQNDIWYRIIQIITGFKQQNIQLQNYAVQRFYSALNFPHITDTMKSVGSYLIAQFSQRIVKSQKDPQKLFDVINKHFSTGSNKSKAMMLNSLVKLAVKYPQLKEQVQMISHLSSGHWDPDVQQRGVQYLALLQTNSSLQKKILQLNPPFSQQQQYNNPILVKLSKKGKKQNIGQNNAKSNLKTLDNGKNAPVGNFSHPLSNHPCYRLAIDRLCKNNVNLVQVPGKLQLQSYWKQAYVKKGSFQKISIKQKIQDNVLKVILAIAIQTQQMQFKVFKSKGFDVTISPVKYGGDCQQIMLTFVINGQKTQPPSVGIAWKNSNGAIQKKQVQLPISVAKFISPVQLTYQKFNQFYNDYSLPNDKYYKMDAFLRVPDGVKGSQFLKKTGSFLSSVCNFKCSANPSFDNLKTIYSAGKLTLKQSNKTIPILVQCQAYTNGNVSSARVSIRGGNGPVIQSLYQMIVTFMN